MQEEQQMTKPNLIINNNFSVLKKYRDKFGCLVH